MSPAVARRTAATPRAAGADGLARLLRPVAAELAAVGRRVLNVLDEPVARRVVYLITAGGKRLRPALLLLTGRAGAQRDRAALVDAAAAVELIHTATLIHDDIIDQSALRRQQPTFHERWGTERAVLMGDYLYATAFTLLARLPNSGVMRVMADVCRELSRGELLEVEARFRLDLTEAEYLQIVRDKTASLFAGCCRAGGLLAGCPPRDVERLGRFGEQFGLAFQITDDCLDLVGDPEQLGKATLADLDRGALSLPIIYLVSDMTARERQRLFAPLLAATEIRQGDGPWADAAFVRDVARAARASGAVERAQARAASFAQGAQATLAGGTWSPTGIARGTRTSAPSGATSRPPIGCCTTVPPTAFGRGAMAGLNGMARICHELAAYAVSRRS